MILLTQHKRTTIASSNSLNYVLHPVNHTTYCSKHESKSMENFTGIFKSNHRPWCPVFRCTKTTSFRKVLHRNNPKTSLKFAFFRIFWVVIVHLAALGAIALSLSNWRRYSANPTVVSLRKDFRNWNNAFPSATACFLQRVNKQYANNYIFE